MAKEKGIKYYRKQATLKKNQIIKEIGEIPEFKHPITKDVQAQIETVITNAEKAKAEIIVDKGLNNRNVNVTLLDEAINKIETLLEQLQEKVKKAEANRLKEENLKKEKEAKEKAKEKEKQKMIDEAKESIAYRNELDALIETASSPTAKTGHEKTKKAAQTKIEVILKKLNMTEDELMNDEAVQEISVVAESTQREKLEKKLAKMKKELKHAEFSGLSDDKIKEIAAEIAKIKKQLETEEETKAVVKKDTLNKAQTDKEKELADVSKKLEAKKTEINKLTAEKNELEPTWTEAEGYLLKVLRSRLSILIDKIEVIEKEIKELEKEKIQLKAKVKEEKAEEVVVDEEKKVVVKDDERTPKTTEWYMKTKVQFIIGLIAVASLLAISYNWGKSQGQEELDALKKSAKSNTDAITALKNLKTQNTDTIASLKTIIKEQKDAALELAANTLVKEKKKKEDKAYKKITKKIKKPPVRVEKFKRPKGY